MEHRNTDSPELKTRSSKGPTPRPVWRFAPVFAACLGSLAVVGFFVGIREPRTATSASTEQQPPAIGPLEAPRAVAYSEIPQASLRPNVAGTTSLSDLKFERPGVFDPVVRTDDMKLAALADRARNRAYDGAPPTIPHPIDQQTVASCLACHGEGIKVGERVASKISHPHLSNCTQCHVEQSPIAVDNGFVGIYRAGPGDRANPGAPPTIPHHTFMRNDCLSCHGLITRPGTRTTHPWLTNCQQCHAPSAQLDHVEFIGAVQ
jgi:cytochrome c-type protein NapB